jgi:17 kDa outer membrane surface antigen
MRGRDREHERGRIGRRIPGWQRAASTLSIVLIAGACGMPAQFGFSSNDNRTDPSSFDLISALSTGALTDGDLAVASAATTTLLDYRDGGPWENPATGARGTITPLAAAYRDNGVECRDFLASYVHERAEAWMQGEACRNRIGGWEVRNLRPWRR